MADIKRTCRPIAFYLPQFHPIPENNSWWEPGFTEWTYITRARSLFPGHYQPRRPAHLGYYDLRVEETRIAQADLAQAYGLEAFCYWHYWIEGRRLLERPFQQVLESGKPNFPFCLAWANHHWRSRKMEPIRILMDQTYGGAADNEAHFSALLPAFRDERYVRVEQKPLFLVFDPFHLPEPVQFAEQWQKLARQAGLDGIYLVGISSSQDWNPQKHGFDGMLWRTFRNPRETLMGLNWPKMIRRFLHRPTVRHLSSRLRHRIFRLPEIYSYQSLIQLSRLQPPRTSNEYPWVMPGWDNTPRYGARGSVLQGSTPALFRQYLEQAIQQVADRTEDHRLLFIQGWNEWSEGSYLEPDQKYGMQFLEAMQAAVVTPTSTATTANLPS